MREIRFDWGALRRVGVLSTGLLSISFFGPTVAFAEPPARAPRGVPVRDPVTTREPAAFSAVARRPVEALAYSATARQERSVPDDDREFSLSTGFEFSRGDFNDSDRTEIQYVPFTLKLQDGPWIAALTVPYIRIDGPGDVVGGAESGLVIGRGAVGRQTESGLGDIVASLSYTFLPERPEVPLIELTGRVKLPTADEDDGLGTGKTDFGLQVDLAKRFGKLSTFATLGYRFLGDPSGVDLDDGFLGSLGFSYRFGPKLSGGLAYDAREASTSGTDGSRELVPFLTYRWSDSLRLGTYAVIGMSDSSPDTALGFNTRVSW